MYIPDATDRFVRKDGSAGLPAYDIFVDYGSETKFSFGQLICLITRIVKAFLVIKRRILSRRQIKKF